MPWPKDPYITDTAYTTPLPCQQCERQLWRIVAQLYEYNSLAALMKVNDGAAAAEGQQQQQQQQQSPSTSPTTSPAQSPKSSTTRAEVRERRSAFIAAADSVSATSSQAASPLAPAATPAAPPVTTVPSTSVPNSPFIVRGPSGTWGSGGLNVSGGSSHGSTAFIRATCARAMQPLQSLLAAFCQRRFVLGAGIVDVAVQHPLACFRVELVRLLLSYPLWDWAMCAPVAVAAGVGDVDVLQLLLDVRDLDPNTGFPLSVAVRKGQEETTLPVLLASTRIKPNYGGPFYVSVVLGNVKAMHVLGSAIGVNVNRFANNEGTSALLYALRQFLICRRWEQQQAELQPSSSTPLLHAAKPPQTVTAPTDIPTEEINEEGEEEITATPLLVVQPEPGVSPRKEGPFTKASLSQRDKPLFGSRSPEEEGGRQEEMNEQGLEGRAQRTGGPVAAAAAHASLDDTHSGAFRKDTKEQPLRTARHWLEVLLYLLDHPAIEINAGFYMTPLQTCVMAGNVEVVGWLLQHPHLRPNRLPKATTVLCNAYYLLQHQALSPLALQCVVAAPLEMAAQLRHLDIFRLLARDQRVQVPVRLTMDLERSAADAETIPFMTVLAQYREDWEGWGWRWRRLCLYIATAAMCVVALCYWVTLFFWRRKLRGCLLVLTGAYLVGAVMSVLLHVWELHRLRYPSEASLTGNVATLLALIRHLCPGWSSYQQYALMGVLLACPGMLPLLDVVCAVCLYQVHHSRQRLESASADGGGGGRVRGAASGASPTSITPTSATQTAGGADASRTSPSQRAHAHHHHRHRAAFREGPVDHTSEMHRLSSTTSWGWSVGVSNASDNSANSSFSDTHDYIAAAGRSASGYGGDVQANESFSRPRPSAARARRQSGLPPHNAPLPLTHNTGASVMSEPRETPFTSPTYGRQFSFGAASSVNGRASATASPSLCSRSRGPWVVPGRPSRYAVAAEFRAPDLLLRAQAYTAYDKLLTLPRLLTCVVGVFMFLYMVFPTAAPDASGSENAAVGALQVLQGHSTFTLYYGASPRVSAEGVTSGAGNGGRAAVEALASSESLPAYTAAIGVVGLCGLVASVVGGGALLAIMFSLRNVTVHAFFASPTDKADAKGNHGRISGRPERSNNADWREVRHRTRDAQPDYTL